MIAYKKTLISMWACFKATGPFNEEFQEALEEALDAFRLLGVPGADYPYCNGEQAGKMKDFDASLRSGVHQYG